MFRHLYLSQNEPCKKQRLRHLAKMQKRYAFSLTYRGQIATINKLPVAEKPNLYYFYKAFTHLAKTATSLPRVIIQKIKYKLFNTTFNQYSDYLFFANAPIPNKQMWENFEDNKYLGYQRVAGMNAVVLQGVTADEPLPENFNVSPAALNMDESKFANALETGRFYMTNYQMLEPLMENSGMEDGARKYVSPAIALYQRADDGSLDILAIQLDVTKPTSKENPIITPKCSRWSLARAFIQVADATLHEIWTHATQAHYVMESVIMVTHRQLATNHPLFALLYPHLQDTLSVNTKPLLQCPTDGLVPKFAQMFACNNSTLVDFIGKGMNNFSFKEQTFPKDIAKRKVEDPKLCYPYRDDGKLWWDESQRFAAEFLNHYYPNDGAVCADEELQNWAYELGGSKAQNNCGLTDFPTSFNNVRELAEIVGHILFIATAHHASIHYPQYECAGYVPNMPYSVYTPPSTVPNHTPDQAQMMGYFPRLKMAFYQSFIFYATNFRVNRAGDYPTFGFDQDYKKMIAKHQQKIAEIGEAIDKQNRTRVYKYHYMEPKNVTNSITV